MHFRSLTTFAVAAAATLSVLGCSDSPMAPQAAPPTPQATPGAPQQSLSGLLGGLLGRQSVTQITPLQRKTPLAKDIRVSKTIGILGGTLVVPEAGLTVIVPPLAVTRPTTFQVTARKGSDMAYDFEPHGIRFTTPLVMLQNLHDAKTDGSLLNLDLSLGYYPDSKNVTAVTELLNVRVDLLSTTAVSTIWHFSGYIYASGRSGFRNE